MRRGPALVFCLAILGGMAPSAFGQYPYPPAPPMYGPPMPYYSALPYYPAPPMWQAPLAPKPNVIIYGPLNPIEEGPRPGPGRPLAYGPAPAPVKPAPVSNAARSGNSDIRQVQASYPADRLPDALPAKRNLADGKTIRRTDLTADAHGPGCYDPLACSDHGPCEYGPCDPVFGHITPPRPLRGHGRFIGEVGAYFLLPYTDSRLAYTTTDALATSPTDFPRGVYFGPRAALGYMFHTGWGIRANAWYVQGEVNGSISNSDVNTEIATALAPPFQIVSPSMTLQQGIGGDQFSFTQQIRATIADIECLREFEFGESTFLFSLGGRYARLVQEYSASRNNPGGFNSATTVNVDRENLDSSSRFEGWGPTGSAEIVCMLGKSNVSVYSNLRGSFLWGVQRFGQSYQAQRNSVDNRGVPTFAELSNSLDASDRRTAYIGDVEAGLQYGCMCFGRCYFFARGGAVYQRWWDVGSPASADGSLNFLGGTVRVGLTY